MNELNDLSLPTLPELNAGYIVVQKEAWKILTDYIRLQTSTINTLIDTVESLENLCNLRAISVDNRLQTVASEVAEIAQALEGAYVDE